MLIDSGFVTSSLRLSGSYTQTGNSVITGSLLVTQGGTGNTFIQSGSIGLFGFPTSITFGNGQRIFDDGQAGLAISSSANISIITNSVTRLLVSSSGNVGIGTSTPTLALLQVQGNVSASSFTGSLFGTSSHAVTASFFGGSIPTATSASYASSSTSASYALNAGNAQSASFATNANSSSYALNAGNAQTASFAINANSASYALNAGNAQTASFATNASNAFIQNGNSFGVTAVLGTNDSQSLQLETSGSIRVTISGSGAVGVGTLTPTLALLQVQGNVSASSYSGSLLGTASFATNANSSSYALNAGNAISSSFSTNAGSASYALNAGNTITASFATNANSASYALNAGNAQSSSFASTASSADNFTVRGTLTAVNIVTQTITSSVSFLTGSTRFGTLASNTHVFTGSVSISGSLTVQGAISGSNITGSLLGTASYASNALSSSYAVNAGNAISASFATNVGSASYALNAGNSISSSFATNAGSASYALNAGNTQTASFATNAANAFIQNGNSFGAAALLGTNDAQNLQFETNGTVRVTISGSGAIGVGTATPTLALLQIQGNVSASSYSGSLLGTASFATNANSSSYALNAGNAISSSFATNAGSASYALNAGNAISASWAPAGAAAAGTSHFIATGSISASLDINTTQIFRLLSGSSIIIQANNVGNVGIGTSSPQYRLHVSGVLGFASSSANSPFADRDSIYHRLYEPAGNIAMYLGNASDPANYYDNTNHYFRSRLASTTYATINSNGNLGIGLGSTFASAKLHISASTNNALRIESEDVADTNATVYIEGNKVKSSPGMATSIEIRSDIDFRGRGIVMSVATASQANIRWFAGVPYQGSGYSIGYDNTASRLPHYYESSSLFITNTRNIGIGTTSPSARLEIKSSATNNLGGLLLRATSTANFPALLYENSSNGGTLDLYNAASLTTRIISNGDSYFNGGKVGIGTTSPQSNLTVYDLSNTFPFTAGGNSATPNVVALGTVSSVPSINGYTYNFGAITNLALQPNGGNVGIGTTSPASKLDIAAGSISVGTNSATEGTILLQDQYSVGHLTNIGTNRSSGGPMIGYGVYPSAGATNAFSSSTSITAERAAFSFDGSFRWYTGGAQAVSIGAAATLSQRMVLNNNGNLGIGTTSPTAILDVVGQARITQNAAAFQLDGDNHVYMEFYPTNSLSRQAYFGFPSVGSTQLTLANEATNGDIILLLNGTGKVGIGTSSPGYTLDVVGPMRAYTNATYNGENGALIASNSTNLNKRVFIGYDGTLDAGFITSVFSGTSYKNLIIQGVSVGNVGIGSTTAAYKLDVAGDIRATGDVIAFSDARVKDNVETITNALAKVTSLRGVSYIRNDSEDKSRKVGVIAQEVKEILPEVVQQDSEGKYSVAYGNMVSIFIEAIKEQQNQINDLRKQINYLAENK